MKTRISIILIALGFSLGGCYTSFSAREYEEESFGQVEEGTPADSMIVFEDEDGNLDTVFLYTGNYTEINDQPNQDLTVINNYYGEDNNDYWVSGFFGFPRFYTPVAYYPYCDPFFYDPYYCNYYPPYYSPYYGGNIFVYGDMYVGHYYGNNYYPSPERYRTAQSHWTNLRNNDGGRSVSRKSRDSYRSLPVATRTGGTSIFGKGINLDRDMENISVSKRTQLASLDNNGGIRKANLEITNKNLRTNSNANKISKKSTKTRKIVKREAVKQTKPKRTSNKSKYTRLNTSRKRTYTEIQKRTSYGKRKNINYSKQTNKNRKEVRSSRNNSSKSSSKSYKSNRSRSSNNKSYNTKSSRSSYKPKSNSSRSSSSGYSKSKSSSSRSSYSGSSNRSSSRSSYSGSSSRSSSRSSAGRSSSRSSSTRSSGKRR